MYVEKETMSNDYNAVQKHIKLCDDYVHYAYTPNPAERKMKLSFTKKVVDEIELKYVDDENDFIVKWKGTLKNK